MKTSPWILLMCSIVMGAFGQLFMKAGMNDLNIVNSLNEGTLTPNLKSIIILQTEATHIQGILWLVTGITSYLIAMVIWIYVLKHFELSLAYPLLSIGYILVYIGAVTWPKIGEAFLWGKTTGILLIMLGVILTTSPNKSIDEEIQK